VPISVTRTQRAAVYEVSGRQLHLKQQNGALLARVGGGYQELWACLAKMVVPGAQRSTATLPFGRNNRTSSSVASAMAVSAGGWL
jgi:hypothetical protein